MLVVECPTSAGRRPLPGSGLRCRALGVRWLAIGVLAASACRQETSPPPAAPAAGQSAEASSRPAEPEFPNTPEGAARRFLYAWVRADDQLMRSAILPTDRLESLFTLGWVSPTRQREMIDRILNEPVREFHPGDMFPVGLPGQPKHMQPVPDQGLGPTRRLLLLAERGLFAVQSGDRWLIDADPIIDSFERSVRFNPPPAKVVPAATQPTTTPTTLPASRPLDSRP